MLDPFCTQSALEALTTVSSEKVPVDLTLISMPYVHTPRPPLAMGILPAILKQAGFRVETLYANLLFAERIGWYMQAIVNTHKNLFIPEFLFAETVFPGTGRVDAFLQELVKQNWQGKRFVNNGHGEHLGWYCQEANRFTRETAEAVLEQKPAIVGCSSTFLQQVPSLGLLRLIKEQSPETITLLGGANCEGIMGQAVHRLCPWVDYVVSGDADGLITSLIQGILNSGTKLKPEHTPVGVYTPAHRDRNYQAHPLENGITRAVFRDLDSLPVPDFKGFFKTLQRCPRIKESIRPALTAESSRGCWWGQKQGCRFCGLNGVASGYVAKSPEKTMSELRQMSREYGITQFSMVDNIMEADYFSTFLPLLSEAGKPFRLFYETRSNLSRPEFEAMRKAGINWIQPGIESLSSELLQHMNKGVRAWQHVRLLKLSLEYGVRLQWFILYSFPGEKSHWYKEMAELIPYLHHLQPPHSLIPMQLGRFSAYYEHAREYDIEAIAPPMAKYCYPFRGQDLLDLMTSFEPRDERVELDHNILSFFMEDPAVRSLRGVGADWILAFWQGNGQRPILQFEDDGRTLRVYDTRRIATAETHEFSGAKRRLYRVLCEEYPRTDQALRGFGKDWSREADRFIENNLAIRLDNRILGLAHPEPVASLPKYETMPMGSTNLETRNEAEPR